MFYCKEQVQELNDELGEMEVWDYMRSKNDLINIIQKRDIDQKLGHFSKIIIKNTD